MTLTLATANKRLLVEMKRSRNRSLILIYIYLAAGCAAVGMVMTFFLLLACQYFGIDLFENISLLAIPPVSALFVNVLLVELYKKIGRR